MYRSTLIFAVLLAATVSLPAQLSQTLPRGWEGISADFLLHEVVNDVSNDRWQWHYDTTEFDATGPILITEISVRSSSDLFLLNAFNFPQIIITLHEAST
ncbi:MAG: hypothetical protein KDB53_02015, partial [Planctomycetes bacterium]|nr:hypothetical protein [Planctomycetota bacterium]